LAVDTVEQQTGVPVVGPVTWLHPDGLAVDIPAGWMGVEAAQEALYVVDGPRQLALHIFHPYGDNPSDCGAPSWVPLRAVATQSRALAQIGPVPSWSSISSEPKGASRECWIIDGLSSPYLVAVEYPFGSIVAGRNLITKILDTIRVGALLSD
jgi:hypothetical protein